ncbi:MAG: HAD family acid phosphatase, partial [Stackebrandtia sp.]
DRRSMWISVAALLVATACTPASPPGEQRPSYQQWQDDVNTELRGARGYLDEQDGGSKAIVLDIDNTALETEYHPGEPNPPVLEVARHARERGMAVLIVTARMESDKDKSLRQLEDAGYSPDDICLRELGESKAAGKVRCRKEYTKDGYTITANIGNRATDFKGGYFDREYRLPDYDGQLS